MSIKNNAIIVATCVFGLGLGYSVSSMWSSTFKRHSSSSSTSFASQAPDFMPPKVGKHLAVVVAEIVPLEKVPDSGDSEVYLTGRISLQQDIDGDIEYEWTLPEGVTVVEGVKADGIANVRPGQTIELRLQVTGFTKETQKVVALQASALKGGMRFGNSAILASRPEDSMESFAPQMKEEAARQLQPIDRSE